MKDVFGTDIKVGQHVFYADYGDEGEPAMSMYEVTEIDDGVIKGELLNGATGNWFYLEDTETRAVVIGDVQKVYSAVQYYRDSTVH